MSKISASLASALLTAASPAPTARKELSLFAAAVVAIAHATSVEVTAATATSVEVPAPLLAV